MAENGEMIANRAYSIAASTVTDSPVCACINKQSYHIHHVFLNPKPRSALLRRTGGSVGVQPQNLQGDCGNYFPHPTTNLSATTSRHHGASTGFRIPNNAGELRLWILLCLLPNCLALNRQRLILSNGEFGELLELTYVARLVHVRFVHFCPPV